MNLDRAIPWLVVIVLVGCGGREEPAVTQAATSAPASSQAADPTANTPPLSPNNIVSLALNSPDHTTLVTAIKAADYVTAVAASGPLTVFAPTNAAFEALPAGTVDSLLKPENAPKLREILKYHVTTSALDARWLQDGQTLGMANGAKATIRVEGGRISINEANVVQSVRAENGMLHIIDGVLIPPEDG